MNKITTTAGLVVLGAASFQTAVQAQMTAPGENKPWSISAVLRGFYDDNYTTSSSDLRRDSFGIEVDGSSFFIGSSFPPRPPLRASAAADDSLYRPCRCVSTRARTRRRQAPPAAGVARACFVTH